MVKINVNNCEISAATYILHFVEDTFMLNSLSSWFLFYTYSFIHSYTQSYILRTSWL